MAADCPFAGSATHVEQAFVLRKESLEVSRQKGIARRELLERSRQREWGGSWWEESRVLGGRHDPANPISLAVEFR